MYTMLLPSISRLFGFRAFFSSYKKNYDSYLKITFLLSAWCQSYYDCYQIFVLFIRNIKQYLKKTDGVVEVTPATDQQKRCDLRVKFFNRKPEKTRWTILNIFLSLCLCSINYIKALSNFHS